MTIGTSASMLSTGVFRRKPDVESAPPRPSMSGRPPPPPSIGSTTWTCRWPVRRSSTEATTGEIAPAGAAGHAPGQRLGERAEDGVEHAEHRAVAHADRRRELGVDDAARRRRHPHRPQDAGGLGDPGVLGDEVGVDRLAQERMRDAVGRDVERRADLRVGAREVEVDRVARDRQRDLEPDRHLRAEVVLHILGEPVGPVGDLPDRRPRPLLGVVEHARRSPSTTVARPNLPHHLLDAPVARVTAATIALMSPQFDLGDAAVVADQVLDVLLEDAGPVELRRAEPQPLLEDLGRPRPDAGRHRAAHVGGVDEGVAPADDPALVEDRPENVDVGQVGAERARQVGVVADDDVAFVVAVEVARASGPC